MEREYKASDTGKKARFRLSAVVVDAAEDAVAAAQVVPERPGRLPVALTESALTVAAARARRLHALEMAPNPGDGARWAPLRRRSLGAWNSRRR